MSCDLLKAQSYLDSLCRDPAGRAANGGDPLSSWDPVALGKPVTELPKRVWPIHATLQWVITTVVSPGDPFNRQVNVRWNIDDGTFDDFTNVGSNDVIGPAVASGGSALTNYRRWTSVHMWLHKGNSSADPALYTVTLGGRTLGYQAVHANPQVPVNGVGRGFDGWNWEAGAGEGGYAVEWDRWNIPSASSFEIRGHASGIASQVPLPPANGPMQLLKMRIGVSLTTQEVG